MEKKLHEIADSVGYGLMLVNRTEFNDLAQQWKLSLL
jgi:hypothetical protein